MNSILVDDIKHVLAANLPWNLLHGKRIIITGANGFLASFLVEALLYYNDQLDCNASFEIVGVVRNIEKATQKFKNHLDRKDFTLIQNDLTADVESIFNKSGNIVIHAASQASPKYYGTDPVGTLTANIIGTYNLLRASQNNAVEYFMFFSSAEIYGQIFHKEKVSESDYGYLDPLDIRSCYSESKRMAETMCVSWLKQYSIPTKIVRLFHTYGPGMSLDDGRVFADFVADVVAERDIHLKSDGSARRAFCYRADAIRGIFTVLFHGDSGEAYNVGNEACETSILDLAKLVADIFPELNLKVIQDVVTDLEMGYMKSSISRICPDSTRLRLLGWQPAFTLQEGFKKTILSYGKRVTS